MLNFCVIDSTITSQCYRAPSYEDAVSCVGTDGYDADWSSRSVMRKNRRDDGSKAGRGTEIRTIGGYQAFVAPVLACTVT